MILKERKMPIKIKKLQALLRRLPANHQKRIQIESELAKSMAGYRGEKSIDYYLGLLPEKQFGIFHDLRLKNGRGYFQIDTLVISPSFFLIIEVKNIAGTLHFDNKKNQLIRTIEDKVEGLPDPFLQVFNQKIQLEKWLLQNKFPRMPLEHLVVISNPSTIIKTTQYIPELIHNGNIPQKVQQLTQRYKFEHLPTKELKKRSSRLLKKHTPADPDILKLFSINQSELLRGVFCYQCSTVGMKRLSAKWECPSCHFSSKDAHLETLQDYALLIDRFITNQKLRNFLHISSRSTSTRLLKSMQMKHSGSTKGRVYELPLEIQ